MKTIFNSFFSNLCPASQFEALDFGPVFKPISEKRCNVGILQLARLGQTVANSWFAAPPISPIYMPASIFRADPHLCGVHYRSPLACLLLQPCGVPRFTWRALSEAGAGVTGGVGARRALPRRGGAWRAGLSSAPVSGPGGCPAGRGAPGPYKGALSPQARRQTLPAGWGYEHNINALRVGAAARGVKVPSPLG